MARTDHGHHCRPPGHATVATSIDRATELIMRELGQEHAASDRARRGDAPSSAAGGDGKKSKSRRGGEERLPEMAFMTVHEVAVAVWKDIGVPSIEAAEILIRDEHALRMATYEGRPARVCPVTGAKCHPLIESAECPRS
jgi:hypothetical protein